MQRNCDTSSFKFTGWHPNCRCHAVPIFKTDEELAADLDRLLDGDEPLAPEDSDNAVTDVPDGFKTWVRDNPDRLGTSAPYFVRDNRALVEVVASTTRIHEIASGSIDEKIAETCTQLYTRDRYVKIMRHYGVDAVNFERIQTDGLAYQTECNLLRGFFTRDGALQVGELINIANETESGLRIMRKKMTALGMSEEEIDKYLKRLLI